MKYLKTIIMSFTFITTLTGCVSTSTIDNEQLKTQSNYPEVEHAFIKNNYHQLEQYLSPELKEDLSKNVFNGLVSELKNYGTISACDYLATLYQPTTTTEIWKISLLKKNQEKKTILIEKLLHITGGKTPEGRFIIIGLLLL